mmetsp:Transcript_26791/g.62960  ORF Transcript_26791/g.62960 Transcript_26791/m.62960 type:complete len:226 (+) Transcript_26791:248-925(+)
MMSSTLRRDVIRNIRQCAAASAYGNNINSACQYRCNRLRMDNEKHEKPMLKRCYGSAAIEDSSSNNKGGAGRSGKASNLYVSPFQDIFSTIQEGKTFLGTKEFQYPNAKVLKCGVSEHHLRFKTTTYGRLLEEPFVRPNEHRVILQVAIRHIPLTDTQKLLVKEIVGHRLNDDTGILQLSSSQFGSRIENKRHVVSMLERAVESAKNLTARLADEEDFKSLTPPS